jgi:hypothetical protein
MFISFAPPKEMNQRKRGRKRQPALFFAICTLPFSPPKNRTGSHLFRIALAPYKARFENKKRFPGERGRFSRPSEIYIF